MNEKTCPICHTPIPGHAPGGLCPACILRDADEPVSFPPGAPSLEEVAAAFPRLEIIRLIGHGGMGYVYQARQTELDRPVALKVLSPSLRSDPSFEERFSREARVLGKLQHPNIVTLYEHGEAGGFFYLLMEFVDGVNLRQAMSAGRFTPEQALAIVPHICDALQSAHSQGIWHRDIKPENILLDKDGRVKIADFGIARILGDSEKNFTLTLTRSHLGTAAYMAPEQHEKPHEVDHRADIYSLGVVIYEMLTGELPLGRFPAPSERAAVNARVDEIVFRTLEKERELRQQSATQVKTEVEGLKSSPTESHQQASATSAHPSPWDGSSLMKKWLIIAPFIGGSVGLVLMLLNKAGVKMSPLFLQSVIPILFLVAFSIGIIVMKRSRFSAKGHPREKTNHDEDGHETLKSSPRLSRTALLSACLIAVPFLAELIAPVVPGSFSEREMYPTIGHVVAILGVMGATILGWIAVGWIRRSGGWRHGLWLGLIGGLFFPLLLLDFLLTLFFHKLGIACGWWTQTYDDRSNALLIVYSMLVWPVVDFLIIRHIWRTIRVPAGENTAPPNPPTSYIRKTLTTVILLSIGLLAGAAILIDEAYERELALPQWLFSKPETWFHQKRPVRSATAPENLATGTSGLRIEAGGGYFEILGIRDCKPGEDSDWWSPSGGKTNLSREIYTDMAKIPAKPGVRGIEMCLHQSFPKGAYIASLSLFLAKNAPTSNSYLIRCEVPENVLETDSVFLIGHGDWSEDGPVQAVPHPAKEGSIEVEMKNFSRYQGNTEYRIVVVDKDGAIHPSWMDVSERSAGQAERSTFHFGGSSAPMEEPLLTMESISRVVRQYRERTPITIHGLSVKAGHITQPRIEISSQKQDPAKAALEGMKEGNRKSRE